MIDGQVVDLFDKKEPREEHEVTLTGLRPNRIYSVRLGISATEDEGLSKHYQLDTSFNYTKPLIPEGRNHPLAKSAIERTGIDRGLAVVLGAKNPEVATTLARLSQLRVVILDDDARAIQRCRKVLLDQGLYGDRVTACHVPVLADAPIPPHCVNLLIGTAGNRLKRDETLSFLAPGNGTAISSGGMIRAPEIPGSGTWTHMYANPDNTGYGGESLGGVQNNERLTLQWIGRPGPRYQSDRGNRKPAPLAVSGRLYIQGLQRIIALDGNNGSIIWSLELPEVQRFNIPRDTSNWCADEDHLYVAGERLLVIDGKTGTLLRTQAAPAPANDLGSYEWGYVARSGKHLIGSAQRKGNTHTGWWGSKHWYDGKDDFSILKVCSDSLFATDPDTGSVRWRYEPNALIINASITAADGQLVFLEAGDDSLFDQSTRKIEDGRIWEQLELVALDQETGTELWRREANPIPGRIAVYTAAANGILYLQTSDTGAFALYAFDLETGASLWRQKFNWEADHHGKHLSRLAVAEGLLYLRPYVLNSRTGEIMRTEFPKGHQCGNYACTTDSLILRAGDLAMWAPLENTVSKWNRVRPDCWISTIPAYGMLLSPEGGGGCSCGSWIESSMGFRPVFEGKPGRGLRTGMQE
jgi:outer membrane protein assembly factor BamB